ncbi:MAG TPA: D-cysteine desulfhydrase family protein [Ilumatobacter sp.]|nr:D-cysteine desulfhydrase family protein [Ilumatobacter sp.]
MFGHLPWSRLATLPTPLERGPRLPGGARLWLKRDDLTGLGMGGNKARKLEFLVGAAVADGARSLVTVGAAQSNHCRMTAAAGALLGLEVHLVLSGDRPAVPAGNQILSALFGAQMHYTGAHDSHWGELEIAREALADELTAGGAAPYSIPIGGSTAVGALGYASAFFELMEQCRARDVHPAAIVVTSSSGGTHAGLVAGKALWRERHGPTLGSGGGPLPEVLAIGVAKGVNVGSPDIAALARETIGLVGQPGTVEPGDVQLDTRWLGDDYAVPTAAGDAAVRWAARHGGWVLDRTYTGKGFAGLVANAEADRWPSGGDVIFIHTGGTPAVFAPGGVPL